MTKDLIVVGRSRSLPGSVPLQFGTPLQDAVRRMARSTLHVSGPTALARPILVVQAGSRLLDRALAAAVRLAGPTCRDLDIVLIGDPASAARLQADIKSRLAPLDIRPQLHSIGAPTLEQLSRALAEIDGDILVAAADLPLSRERDDLSLLLERTGLPVMIVQG